MKRTRSIDDAKTVRLTIRLSPSLAEPFFRRVADDGATAAEVARACLADYVDGNIAPPAYARALKALRHELRKLGTNLNQIARTLHRDGGTTDVERAADDIARQLRDIAKRTAKYL